MIPCINSEQVPRSLQEFSVMGRGLSAEAKEGLRDIFIGSGIAERDLAVWDYKKYFRLSVYSVTFRRRNMIRKRAAASGIRGLRFRERALKPADWLFRWQETYRIMPAGKKFLIVPAWKRKDIPAKSQRIPVVLDPGSAFGTGGHETTKLMIRLLEAWKGKFRNFLDVGTGSGVLSIIAKKLGAGRIAAFDNDPMSVRIAKKNFQENNCRGGEFFSGDLKRFSFRRRFDCVGANLLSKTLLGYRRKLLRCVAQGGYLVISGVARRHFDAFKEEFRMPALKCLKILYSRSWAGAVYQRRKT